MYLCLGGNPRRNPEMSIRIRTDTRMAVAFDRTRELCPSSPPREVSRSSSRLSRPNKDGADILINAPMYGHNPLLRSVQSSTQKQPLPIKTRSLDGASFHHHWHISRTLALIGDTTHRVRTYSSCFDANRPREVLLHLGELCLDGSENIHVVTQAQHLLLQRLQNDHLHHVPSDRTAIKNK